MDWKGLDSTAWNWTGLDWAADISTADWKAAPAARAVALEEFGFPQLLAPYVRGREQMLCAHAAVR